MKAKITILPASIRGDRKRYVFNENAGKYWVTDTYRNHSVPILAWPPNGDARAAFVDGFSNGFAVDCLGRKLKPKKQGAACR